MESNYAACHNIVKRWEGGKVDHPADPGGRTAYGITQRVYDGYRKRLSKPVNDVYRITVEEMAAIYKPQYWDAVRGDDLPRGLDLAVYDFSVNSGPTRAAKYLQEALRKVLKDTELKVDGAVGEATLGACKRALASGRIDDVINVIFDMRLAFLKRLDTWATFGKGWSNRLNDVRPKSLKMAATPGTGSQLEPVPSPPIAPDVQPDHSEPTAKGNESDTKVTETPAGKEGAKQTTLGIAGLLAWVAAQVQSLIDMISGFTGVAPETVGGVMRVLVGIMIALAVATAVRKLYVIWKAKGQNIPLEEV